MKTKQLWQISLLPIVGVILAITWVNIATTDYYATIKHWLALTLVMINVGVCFYRFTYGVIMLGVILLLGTLSLIAFFPQIESTSYFIRIGNKEISTPHIQWKLLLMLVYYFICNASFLIDLYAEYKERNENKV